MSKVADWHLLCYTLVSISWSFLYKATPLAAVYQFLTSSPVNDAAVETTPALKRSVCNFA